MEWGEVQKQMEAREKLATTAMGALGVLAGLLLLRRPGPRWVAYSIVANGGLLAATGQGLLTRIWKAVSKQPPGETPALSQEV
jgi:hypothetical protein